MPHANIILNQLDFARIPKHSGSFQERLITGANLVPLFLSVCPFECNKRMRGLSRHRKRNAEHSVHIPLGLKTHWPRMNAWLTDWLIPSGWLPIDSIKLCTIDHIYQKRYSSTKQGQKKEADLMIRTAGMVEWLRCGMTFGQSLSLNLPHRVPAEEKFKKKIAIYTPLTEVGFGISYYRFATCGHTRFVCARFVCMSAFHTYAQPQKHA